MSYPANSFQYGFVGALEWELVDRDGTPHPDLATAGVTLTLRFDQSGTTGGNVFERTTATILDASTGAIRLITSPTTDWSSEGFVVGDGELSIFVNVPADGTFPDGQTRPSQRWPFTVLPNASAPS